MSTSCDDSRPIACDLSAVDATQRARRTVIARALHGLRVGIEELPDGYAFWYIADSSTLMKIVEFVSKERLCCPFFAFAIEVERAGAAMRLRLRGGDGVKRFIAGEFGIKG